MAYFWLSNYITDIVGAFLATGILRLRGTGGHSGWQYLFLIEGSLTLAIGIVSFFMMPAGPTQTKAWFRPNGWFSERFVQYTLGGAFLLTTLRHIREEIILVNRYVSVH